MKSAIFSGQVSHSRKAPSAHAFRYRIFMMYLDLDETDTVFRGRWLWSTRAPALARFDRRNHLGDPREPLAESVRSLVQERTGVRPKGPIRLLTHLSYFGYCFNPISLYYCFDEHDTRVQTVVAEVTNTPWGERRHYVLADNMNVGNDAARRFRTNKELHVSPFMDMNMRYDWLLTEPGEDLVLRIGASTRGQSLFGATMILKRVEINAASLAKVLIFYPFITAKVTIGIHWQALRLWLKGTPVQAHPKKQESIEATR